MSEAEHQIETETVNSDSDTKLVQMEEETRKQKEPGQGDGEESMTGEAQDESNEHYPSIVREGDREDKRKRVDLQDEEKDLKEEVDAKQGEKLKKLDKGSKNSERGEEGNKEIKDKKTVNNSGHPEGERGEEKKKSKAKDKEEKEKAKAKEKEKTEEKKKEKKEKKSKSSSERIQKKLEKINAKIGRILAKKEEYELRLKEALERERQEAENAEGLVAPANNSNGPGLRSEDDRVADQLRLVDDASTKESNKSAEKGLPGSLSRTDSLVEATPTELLKEVASQKEMVEKLSKLELRDGESPALPMENTDVVMIGAGEVSKHTLEVDDSKDIGTSIRC